MDYKDDDDVRLVDEYADLISRQKEIRKRLNELKADLIALSKQKQMDRFYGSGANVLVKEYQKVLYPKDKTELINRIREKGLYDELSVLSYYRLRSRILKGDIDDDIIELTEREIDHRLYLSKKKE